jgi:hypothetical protein
MMDSKVCGFMHAFWTIPDRAKLHKCGVGEHGVQMFKVILCFCFCYCRLMFLSPQVHITYHFGTIGLSICTSISLSTWNCALMFFEIQVLATDMIVRGT